ncbi:MAG: hypothetical protein JXB34_10545 [Bacteroidales bacterium]|nr:hypothetical protein [Bacteroidales bacterium]
MGKKKIIKKFEQLTPELLKLIKETYPDGYEENLIVFQTPNGELSSALPLETEDVSYLIRMPKGAAPDDDDDVESNSSENDFENFEDLEIAEDTADDE